MTITTYNMKAGNGRQIRKATMVTLNDGREIRFTERMSRREVLTNLEGLLAMAMRHNMITETALFTDAVEQYVNQSSFPAVSA